VSTDPNLRGGLLPRRRRLHGAAGLERVQRGERALFRRLYERQAKLVARYACPEWIEAIGRLDAGREIPKFGEINKKPLAGHRLGDRRGAGAHSDGPFFQHLASGAFR